MKSCCRCHKLLPLNAFDKDPHVKSGIRGSCKACRYLEYKAWYSKNKHKAFAYSKQWHNANPEKVKISQRKSEIKRKYNLSWDQYLSKLSLQDSKCAICSSSLIGHRNCCVDHNHDTNQIRDLLCSQCNKLIGFARENSSILQAAIVYLDKHRT